jgi:hypothetical protein
MFCLSFTRNRVGVTKRGKIYWTIQKVTAKGREYANQATDGRLGRILPRIARMGTDAECSPRNTRNTQKRKGEVNRQGREGARSASPINPITGTGMIMAVVHEPTGAVAPQRHRGTKVGTQSTDWSGFRRFSLCLRDFVVNPPGIGIAHVVPAFSQSNFDCTCGALPARVHSGFVRARAGQLQESEV